MTFIDIATRIDYLSAHELEHAIELERLERAARQDRPRRSRRRDAPMSAAGRPTEAPFDFSQIYA